MSARNLRRVAAAAATLLLALAGATTAATIQDGGLRITVLSQVQPYKLPRHGTAPIAVFVGGPLKNATGGIPPQLNRLDVKVNRHGLLQSEGLPACGIDQIQPASTERALEACGPAVIGSGQFWAHIVLAGQAPYPTHGRLLIFNGKKKGKPALLAHIYTSNPFNASFVVPFTIREIHQGPYGTDSSLLPRRPGQLGLRRSDQAHPEAQIHLQGPTALLLQRRLPCTGGVQAHRLPIGLRDLLLRRAGGHGGEREQGLWGGGVRE